MSEILLSQFEALIRRDPARRGLIGSEVEFGPLCAGHLAAAATNLAQTGTHVAIATGFYIPRGEPPAAETDGPLGSVLLAQALRLAGMESTLVTDTKCLSAVRAAARSMDFPESQIWQFPAESANPVAEFFEQGPGQKLSHLIAIERVGPSHDLTSLAAQSRESHAPLSQFTETVPAAHFNHNHNMRGEIIDQHTAPLHLLFEALPKYHLDARTIGIGDGGNEIGMGSVPWEELQRRLSGAHSGWVPCRIATDWNILAGTSNWGAYALAAATLSLRQQSELLRPYDREQQRQALLQIVEQGPAVDGITLRREATVDGLPFLTYIQPWEGMRRLLGWEA